MIFCQKRKDGGPESRVWGYFLLEIKSMFSVVLLRFMNGTRDAYHSHAFNSVSWVLSGRLREQHFDGTVEIHWPSLRPVLTYRDTVHKVSSRGDSWVLSFRGPWTNHWFEFLGKEMTTKHLTHGREEI